MTILSIPVRDILPVVPFLACQDIRYYLNGVYVEPVEGGGAVLVATDGHTLAAMFSATTQAQQSIILSWSAAMTMHAKKHRKGKTDPRIVLDSLDSRLTLSAGKEELFIQPGKAWMDGRYPDWRKVVPGEIESGLPGTYQAQYLNKVLAAAEVMGDRNGVQFFHAKGDTNSALMARFLSHPDLMCLVMPMRGEHKEAVPTWAKKLTPAAEATPVQAAA